jgi:hypothetical protein
MTALLAGGISGCGFLTAAKSQTDVKVGDCIVQNKDTLVVTKVACGKNDLGKVYAIPVLPDGDYPGDAKVDNAAQQACLSSSSVPSAAGTLGWTPPRETLWNQGQHDVFCFSKRVKVGDCLAQNNDTHLITAVACGQGGLGKVYAIPVLPAGKFPGDTQVGKATEDACQAASGGLAKGIPISYLPPSEPYWNAGHREVFCMSK